jgi:hypothetical protein
VGTFSPTNNGQINQEPQPGSPLPACRCARITAFGYATNAIGRSQWPAPSLYSTQALSEVE